MEINYIFAPFILTTSGRWNKSYNPYKVVPKGYFFEYLCIEKSYMCPYTYKLLC